MGCPNRLCEWSCRRELPCGSKLEKDANVSIAPTAKWQELKGAALRIHFRDPGAERPHASTQKSQGNNCKNEETHIHAKPCKTQQYNAQICCRETRSTSHHNNWKQLPHREYIRSPPSPMCCNAHSIFVKMRTCSTLTECHGCPNRLCEWSCRRELPCGSKLEKTQTCHSTNSKVARTERSRTEDTLQRSWRRASTCVHPKKPREQL